MRPTQKIFYFYLGALFLLGLVGCGGSSSAPNGPKISAGGDSSNPSTQSGSSSNSASGDGGSIGKAKGSGPDGGTIGATTLSVRQTRPALAVRGMDCVACHAQIQGNVITDFGYGNSWYLGQNVPNWSPSTGFAADNLQSPFSPFTLQTLGTVLGQMTVPESKMPKEAVNQSIVGTPVTEDMDLSAYLMLPNIINLSPSWTGSNAATISFTEHVNAGLDSSGQPIPKVISKNKVYIGAPRPNQILALAGANSPSLGGAKARNSSGTWSSFAGLMTVNGTNGTPYLTNLPGQTIECVNLDVIINGTLFLNNASFHATKGGCRFYVTGSVFIQGNIQYIENSGDSSDILSNLQISSGTAVFMGVGLSDPSGFFSSDPLRHRLFEDSRNPVFRTASDSTAYNNWATNVYQEGVNIGNQILYDAADLSRYPGYATAKSEFLQTRVVVPYTRLLLNAPVIHSRYLGEVQGVFISEILLSSLGNFNYKYDTIFDDTSVKVLPLLTSDILCAGDSSMNCIPISDQP